MGEIAAETFLEHACRAGETEYTWWSTRGGVGPLAWPEQIVEFHFRPNDHFSVHVDVYDRTHREPWWIALVAHLKQTEKGCDDDSIDGEIYVYVHVANTATAQCGILAKVDAWFRREIVGVGRVLPLEVLAARQLRYPGTLMMATRAFLVHQPALTDAQIAKFAALIREYSS